MALGASALAVMTVLGYLLWSSYRETIQAAEATTSGYAAILETRLDATLRRADAVLQQRALTTPIAAMNRDAVSHNARLEFLLKSDLINFPELAAVNIFDVNGDMLYTSSAGTTRPNIADRDHFRKLRDNSRTDMVLSEVIVARTTGRPGVTFARAVRDEQGAFRGAVVALIELQYFQKLHQLLNVGPNGSVAIYRSDNFMRVLRWPVVEGKLSAPLPPDNPVRVALAGAAKTATMKFTSTTDGTSRIYGLHALDNYPFFVAVGIARDDVLTGWRRRTWMASLSTLLLVGLLLALIYRLWRAHTTHAWMATIVDASNDAIVSRDSRGRVLSWNHGAEMMFGYTAAEILGHDISVIAPEALRHELRIGQEKSLDFRAHSRESVRLTKDGRLIEVSIGVAPIRSVAGRVPDVALIFRDITARKQAEEARSRLAAVTERSNDAIFIRDSDGWIVYWNDGARRMYGYASAEVMGKDSVFLVPPELLHERKRNWERLLQGEAMENRETVRLRKDGSRAEVSISVSLVKDVNGKFIGAATVARDITERKKSAQAHAQLAAIVETSNDAIVGRAPDDTIVSWNAAAERMFGWTAKVVLGKPFRSLLSQTPENKRRRRFEMALHGEITAKPLEDIRLRKDGSNIHVETTMSAVRNEHGEILFVACIMRDVTERMKAERHIEQLATKDVLTGLSNRSMLMEQLSTAIARAARSQTQFAVMFIDLDQFKAVNDTLGHAAGDELLRECAKRLVECVREADVVARLGGDEFVVLLTDVIDVAIVSSIADRMLKLLTMPYQLHDHDAQTSASIGICFYPEDGKDVTTLMKNADIAMYHAKALGRDNFQFYAEEMNQRMMRHLQLKRELRAAVENQEFVLHYQPQVAIASGNIQGVESLIRWQHPTRGLLFPAEFIAVTEETGLIVPIGEWVIDHACRTIKAWRAKGLEVPYIVVNVSAGQLCDALVTSVRQALVNHGIEAGWLVLEITETMLMKRVEEAISILRRIRELGIRIAMDDFGTGYSSLSVLQRLPLDTLKIDRSFVSAIDDEANNARACAIIGAIIAIAKELNLSVVAEGVETTTQLAFLRTLNCDAYQGYLFSRPIDSMTLEASYVAAVKSALEDDQGTQLQ